MDKSEDIAKKYLDMESNHVPSNFMYNVTKDRKGRDNEIGKKVNDLKSKLNDLRSRFERGDFSAG